MFFPLNFKLFQPVTVLLMILYERVRNMGEKLIVKR